MKFRSIEKKGSGDYLSRYDIHYETPAGGEKVYEMFSRDPEMIAEQYGYLANRPLLSLIHI